jgi:hypothetical protein
MAARALLRRTPLEYLHSSYVTCFNGGRGTEAMTLLFVLRGLAAWDQVKGVPELRSYVAEAGRALQRNRWFYNYRQYAAAVPNPNAFSQGVMMLLVLERYGIEDLDQSWLVPGLRRLLAGQARKPRHATLLGRAQVYGGWFHTRTRDPGQELGYNGLVIEPLIALDEHLRATGACRTRRWSGLCAQIPETLAASLAWLYNIRDENGLFLNPAPGTSARAPAVFSGTGPLPPSRVIDHTAGLRLAFTLLTYLRERGYRADNRVQVSFDGQTRSFGEIEAAMLEAVKSVLDLPYDNSIGAYLEYRKT